MLRVGDGLMVNKSGNIGTMTATAVVRVFNANGFPHAERRVQKGRYDEGDLTGVPGVAVEIKGGNAARTASDAQIEAWLDETEVERINSDANIGLLIVARKGIGAANAHRWWAITRDAFGHPMRYYLADYLRLLRMWGYGEPLEDAA